MRAKTLCAVLLFVVSIGLGAEEAVLQILIGSPSDARLEEVLYLAAGVELTRAGFDSRRIRTSLAAEFEALDRERIEDQAKEFDTPYVLLVEYAPQDTTIEIDFSLYAVAAESPVASRQLVSPIDIDLDGRVGETVRDLIEEADLQRERTATTAVEGIGLVPRPTPPAADATVGTGTGGARVQGLEIGVNTSGLFVLGAASEYFTYGVAGTVTGGYAPELSALGATFGGRASVIRLFPNEGVEGGALRVVTFGPEVLVGTRYRAPARLGARVSGGAAVLVVSRSEETLAKTVPFVDSGVGARLALGSLVAIGIEINYLVVLETGFPVMGLFPSITVSMEP